MKETRYKNVWCDIDGNIVDKHGNPRSLNKQGYYTLTTKQGVRTTRTAESIVVETFYDAPYAYLKIEGDSLRADNLVAFSKPDTVVEHRGIKYGVTELFPAITSEFGDVYRLKDSVRIAKRTNKDSNTLVYVAGHLNISHIDLMLKAFQYATCQSVFSCDRTVNVTLDTILESYTGVKQFKVRNKGLTQELITFKEFKEHKASDVVDITEIPREFMGVYVTYSGKIVDPNNRTKSVGVSTNAKMSMYRGKPVKYWVYNAFAKVKEYKAFNIDVKDGNEFNTCFNNLIRKGK